MSQIGKTGSIGRSKKRTRLSARSLNKLLKPGADVLGIDISIDWRYDCDELELFDVNILYERKGGDFITNWVRVRIAETFTMSALSLSIPTT